MQVEHGNCEAFVPSIPVTNVQINPNEQSSLNWSSLDAILSKFFPTIHKVTEQISKLNYISKI